MPVVRYGRHEFVIDFNELESVADKVVDVANSGRFELLRVESGPNGGPSWMLIGPGIPIVIDEQEPHSVDRTLTSRTPDR